MAYKESTKKYIPVKDIYLNKRQKSVFYSICDILDQYKPQFITHHKSQCYWDEIDLSSYSSIHLAISKFKGFNWLSKKAVLEIGPSFGPYMHFLKNEYSAIVSGIDINDTEVNYAKEGGLDFTCADARKMPFKDCSFDIVISKYFLEDLYIMSLVIKNRTTTDTFKNNVIKEVHRVLKPNGLFFSCAEDIENVNTSRTLFKSFCRLQIAPELSSYLRTVDILQK